jgi:hypothetical protein
VHLLAAVRGAPVGDHGAEQQGHPGRGGHAEGVALQADQDARGGGQFGDPDELVPGPRALTLLSRFQRLFTYVIRE